MYNTADENDIIVFAIMVDSKVSGSFGVFSRKHVQAAYKHHLRLKEQSLL